MPGVALEGRAVEVDERVEKELQPVRGVRRLAHERVVDDEDGYHPLGPGRGREGGIVPDPEVAGEDDDLGSHELGV